MNKKESANSFLKLNNELEKLQKQLGKLKDVHGYGKTWGYACDEPKRLISEARPIRIRIKEIHIQMLKNNMMSNFFS